MTPLDDLEQLNQIARYRNRLDDIRTWRGQLTDIMLTVSAYSMDLTGIPSTGETPMPGGDALAMMGPWARDAEHGDDLPHPDQVLREWMETIAEHPSPRSWAECWRWHWDNTQHILGTPWADQWRHDIDALRGRLQALAGEAPEKEQPEPDDITQMGHLIPEGVTLTRHEAEHFWPGKLDTKAWDRLRQRAKYHREKGENIPDRKYPVTWIREEIAPHLTSV